MWRCVPSRTIALQAHAAVLADEGFSLGVLFRDHRAKEPAPYGASATHADIEQGFAVCSRSLPRGDRVHAFSGPMRGSGDSLSRGPLSRGTEGVRQPHLPGGEPLILVKAPWLTVSRRSLT